MREIKYQAWLNKQQRMIDVETIEFMDIGGETHAEVTAKVDHEKGGWYTQIRESTHRKTVVPGSDRQVPRVILRQYTGLKDNNDTEIYEDDIDTDEHGNLTVVKYIERYAAYCFVPIELYLHEDYENEVVYQFGYDCFFQNVIPSEYAEIIGNIYENPELLEGAV